MENDEQIENDGTEEWIETDPDLIAMNKINEECNLPLDKNVKLNQSIGKTIKFAKSTSKRKNNTILFVFEDNTFLILKNEWDDMSDSVSFNLDHDAEYQDLMLEGGIISQEKIDKYNKFWKDRIDKIEKEREIEQLQKLLAKYPEYK